MNLFSRKRALPKTGSSSVAAVAAASSRNDRGDVAAAAAAATVSGVFDSTSVATDDSKSLNSHSMLLSEPLSPQEIYRAEKKLEKSRQLINKYVRKISHQSRLQGDTLELDQHGFCYIPFRRFLIILSVPADDPDQVLLHTMVFDLNGKEETRARKQVTCLHHRQVRLGRRGSLIRLEGDEVFLCNAFEIRGLRYADMVDRLDDFMETALTVNADLGALGR